MYSQFSRQPRVTSAFSCNFSSTHCKCKQSRRQAKTWKYPKKSIILHYWKTCKNSCACQCRRIQRFVVVVQAQQFETFVHTEPTLFPLHLRSKMITIIYTLTYLRRKKIRFDEQLNLNSGQVNTYIRSYKYFCLVVLWQVNWAELGKG